MHKDAYLIKISECLKRDLIDSVTSDRIQFSEQKASTAFKYLVEGLKELHDSGEVHRDLKLDNLMFTHALSKEQATEKSRISSGHRADDPFFVKIIDTGAAETLPTGCNYIRCGSMHGTKGCFAPETLGPHGLGDTSQSKDKRYLHGKPSDVWQAGVALYMLLYQCPPYYRSGGIDRSFNSEAAAPTPKPIGPRFVGYSPELLVFPPHNVVRLSEDGKNLFRRIFVLDPEDRITCDEILAHDWITLFASLSDDDFGPQYRRGAKRLVLRRQLRASIERSIHTCKERKSRLLPLTGQIKISNTKFRDLQRAFLEIVRSYDVTGINQETYAEILKNHGLPEFATEEAFKAMDIDGSNTIEYFEFLPVLATFREKTSIEDDELQSCRDYFQMMDLDGDGKITRYWILNRMYLLIKKYIDIE
jgi:serine/threonine protein kinase